MIVDMIFLSVNVVSNNSSMAQSFSQYLSGSTPEWIRVLVSVFIGWLLNASWDYYKHNRDSKEMEEYLLTSIALELGTNAGILNINTENLEKEIREGISSTSYLTPLRRDCMNLVLLNIPKRFEPRKLGNKRLDSFLNISYGIFNMNELIHSREIYRLNNLPIDPASKANVYYKHNISVYDKKILDDTEIVMKYMNILKQAL